jgi:hypothetical protein
MGYVRRTQRLLEEVEDIVGSMRDKEIGTLPAMEKPEIGSNEHNDLCTFIEHKVWGIALPLKDKVPKSWITTENKLDIYIEENGSVIFPAPTTHQSHISITTEPSRPFSGPPKKEDGSDFSRWGTYSFQADDSLPTSMRTWITEYTENERKKTEIRDRFNGIKDQLISFLMTHASLNTALKEMPELEMYISADDLAKVRTKGKTTPTVKVVTTVEKLAIDIDALTQAAVAYRITSAGDK